MSDPASIGSIIDAHRASVEADPRANWVERCPHCGTLLLSRAGMMATLFLEGEQYEAYKHLPLDCTCPQALEDERLRLIEEKNRREAALAKRNAEFRKKLLENSGMPSEWQDHALKLYVRRSPDVEAAYQAAVRFGSQVCNKEPSVISLYISGSVGAGKSFLASCLAHDLIRRSIPILWASMGNILSQLKSAYSQKQDAEEILKIYKKANILVIDDFGKERPSEWTNEQLFALVNYRYERKKPIIITSNYDLDKIADRLTPAPPYNDNITALAITDRLIEMCDPISISAPSWRSHDPALPR